MSRRRRQKEKPRLLIAELCVSWDYLEKVLSLMRNKHSRRHVIWLPTDNPGCRVYLALRQEVPIGMSAEEAGMAHETPSHPRNSNRYFHSREEAQQLVDVLKGHLSEVRITPVIGTALTQVSAQCTAEWVNQWRLGRNRNSSLSNSSALVPSG